MVVAAVGSVASAVVVLADVVVVLGIVMRAPPRRGSAQSLWFIRAWPAGPAGARTAAVSGTTYHPSPPPQVFSPTYYQR